MVRLAPLLVGFSLAAGKTIDIASTSTPPASISRTSKALETIHPSKQVKTLPFLTNVLPGFSPVKRRQGEVRFPHQQQKAAPEQPQKKQVKTYGVSTATPPTPSVNRDSGYHHSGGSGGGGYSQPSYPQTGYSYSSGGYDSYDDGDSSYSHYNSVGGRGGGFLQEIGKYGAILVPILLVIGALFLLPSVVNIGTTTRRRRDTEGTPRPEDSDDLFYRLYRIYASISEEPACVSRLYCEVGAVVGATPYTDRVLRMVEMFFPSENNQNVRVLEKAALSEDAKCHLLECEAWDGKPTKKA